MLEYHHTLREKARMEPVAAPSSSAQLSSRCARATQDFTHNLSKIAALKRSLSSSTIGTCPSHAQSTEPNEAERECHAQIKDEWAVDAELALWYAKPPVPVLPDSKGVDQLKFWDVSTVILSSILCV